MADKIFHNYPPNLSGEQQLYLVETIKNWTAQHGLLVRPSTAIVSDEVNPNHVLATNAPVTLFPSPFPRVCFEQARQLQTIYNELYAKIACNEEWLGTVIQELTEVDDFLAQMWKIHLAIKEEGYAHEFSLGMFRSDYMQHLPNTDSNPSLKQVEFNTISSSFGGLSCLVSEMHTELATYPTVSEPLAYPKNGLLANAISRDQSSTNSSNSEKVPPPNTALKTLAAGLAHAHEVYGPSKSNPELPKCVIFLVQDSERNLFDQLALSSHLYKHHSVPSFRLPTSQIMAHTTIAPKDTNPKRPLIYHPPSSPGTPYEVTVVYFRALYAPTEYNTPHSWAARHHLERSAAIKCPSILLHLSGSKKIQQVLTSVPPDTDHLSSFLSDHSKETITALRSTFAPQYALTTEEGISLALNPETAAKHVLKPQREGGGNNIYRDKIPSFLKSIPQKEYKGYILMELIQPPATAKNIALRSDGKVVSGEVISELGIFGTCLWRNPPAADPTSKDTTGEGDKIKPEILHNTEGGYLMRTKARDSDEGGVAAGFSSLDSLILFD